MSYKGFRHKSTKRLVTSSIVSTIVVVIYLIIFKRGDMDYTTIYNTYNPATFKNSLGSNTKYEDKDQFQLQPIDNLFNDEILQNRINNDLNNFCPVFTFFNDEKIRKLSIEEQKFHKTMLKKWVMLYNSLGFKANVLHYNDAVTNPKMESFVSKKILFNKNNQINENYMKLLAWENKSSQLGESAGFYSDYTIFPMVSHSSALDDLRLKCQNFKEFTLLDDYDFQLIISDQDSITNILESLISKNKDFQILETDKYSDLFADYSIKTFQKLMNSRNTKTITERIPKILDQHLKANRLLNKFTKINIVDPLALSDHYFFRPVFSLFKTLTQCSQDSIPPPPTKTHLKRFDKEIKEKLPDPITPDSGLEYITKVEKFMEELYKNQNIQRGKCTQDLQITVTNELNFDPKALNLISVPHPISILSALKYNKKNVFISGDIVNIEQNNFLTTQLSENFKSPQDLKPLIKNKDLNYIFFNFESMTPDTLRNQISMNLGFEIGRIRDSSPVKYADQSKYLNEIINENMILSQGELMRKLDNVKALVARYGEPMSYVINQRQSDAKIQELRQRLREWDKIEKTTDTERILETQHFESRHDPIVEISENYNKLDATLWHLIKNVRYIDDVEYKELTNIAP